MGFADDHLIPLVDAGLGNLAYLVELGNGSALAVDAGRDLRALHTAAERRGLTVACATDAHLHADFLTGALQLASDDGATVLASAAGHRAFPHTALADDETDLGGLALRAPATPGHTDGHLSFLSLDGTRELGVFTGGSLMTAVWPTHGAGFLCSAPPGTERTTTIGAQKQTNALLAAPDEDTFVRELSSSLGSCPAYFDRLAKTNRRGPGVLAAAPSIPTVPAAAARELIDRGAQIVDVRPLPDFAAVHIPGAVSIPLRGQFATWLDWLLPDDTPLLLVTAPGQDPAELTRQALKIGYERLAGHLTMDTWTTDRGDQATIELLTANRIGDRSVLDIRQQSEREAGHIPDAVGIELGEPAAPADEAPSRAIVHCGHGEREMTAASPHRRAGHKDLAVLEGGPADWAKATSRTLEEGA